VSYEAAAGPKIFQMKVGLEYSSNVSLFLLNFMQKLQAEKTSYRIRFEISATMAMSLNCVRKNCTKSQQSLLSIS
jgi:hypothetical protein